MQINKDNTCKDNKRVDYDYKVGYKFMLDNHSAYKYEIPYNFPFVITHFWTNGMVTLQCGATKIGYNIRPIKPHTSDKKVDGINS